MYAAYAHFSRHIHSNRKFWDPGGRAPPFVGKPSGKTAPGKNDPLGPVKWVQMGHGPNGPTPTSGPKWARAQVALPGRNWAQGRSGPRNKWARFQLGAAPRLEVDQGPSRPEPKRAQAQAGPGPSGPGRKCASVQVGPGPIFFAMVPGFKWMQPYFTFVKFQSVCFEW